ncbi:MULTISPECIES: DoxX family protein [unclassified Sphingomonas]|uniref:DoxX family protein n=1 Tax=unclassified Sphingomonas TaxID=196159 RepID=UPI0021510AC0|nr:MULTISPECIES: DoxX family protein [unclassified Sphingomonas]MCR5871995.1 DoxX family protein [Sphingomonas sp. J344]UUX99731.1 DoxX family protein [Sphingomonas sp. J315]
MPIPASWSDKLLALLRIVAGLAFLQHGTAKFFGVPPFPMELNPMLYAAGAIELVGGALLVIGLFTRPVAFLSSGMCAVGYWLAHGTKSLFPAANGGEAILLFCFIFLYLAAAGGGAWSVDRATGKG